MKLNQGAMILVLAAAVLLLLASDTQARRPTTSNSSRKLKRNRKRKPGKNNNNNIEEEDTDDDEETTTTIKSLTTSSSSFNCPEGEYTFFATWSPDDSPWQTSWDICPVIYRFFVGCPSGNGESCTTYICLEYCRSYELVVRDYNDDGLTETGKVVGKDDPHFNAGAYNNDGEQIVSIMNIDDDDSRDFGSKVSKKFRIEDPVDGCPDENNSDDDDDYYYDLFRDCSVLLSKQPHIKKIVVVVVRRSRNNNNI